MNITFRPSVLIFPAENSYRTIDTTASLSGVLEMLALNVVPAKFTFRYAVDAEDGRVASLTVTRVKPQYIQPDPIFQPPSLVFVAWNMPFWTPG